MDPDKCAGARPPLHTCATSGEFRDSMDENVAFFIDETLTAAMIYARIFLIQMPVEIVV
jgi:hypothetical protein